MRIVFLGNDPWSVPALHALSNDPDLQLALVVTNLPRPAGRGARLTPTAVADAARGAGLPLLEVDGVGAGIGASALATAAPEAIVVVAYGALLPPPVLQLAPHGALNLHFSLLPRWRGAAPVQRAILAGDAVTGVSVMQLDAGLDSGPVLARLETEIGETEDAGSLGGRLAELGAGLLRTTLARVAEGAADAMPQDPAGVTLAPKLTPDERMIDWTDDAVSIARRVRAFGPDPGASTVFRGEPFKVLVVSPAEGRSGTGQPIVAPGVPGTVRWPGEGSPPLVATGRGEVALEQVAPAGRRRMPATAWARGARLTTGERFA